MAGELPTALIDEYAKRKKEILQLATDEQWRALVVLSYAHFEGFISNASLAFLRHITENRPKNSRLTAGVVCLFYWNSLRELESSKSLPSNEVIRHTANAFDLDFRPRVPKRLNLESNATSLVVARLVHCLPIDDEFYSGVASDIDGLVSERNAVAHGELKDIGVRAKEHALFVVKFMNQFRTDLENAAQLKAYLRQ